MALHNNNQSTEAISYFEMAENMDPGNALNRFQKANVLFFLEKYEGALRVLDELMKMCPKEAPIHILTGKIYKKQGRKDLALNHFETALDLDPKDTSMVKNLIDKIHSDNEHNEEADL